VGNDNNRSPERDARESSLRPRDVDDIIIEREGEREREREREREKTGGEGGKRER